LNVAKISNRLKRAGSMPMRGWWGFYFRNYVW